MTISTFYFFLCIVSLLEYICRRLGPQYQILHVQILPGDTSLCLETNKTIKQTFLAKVKKWKTGFYYIAKGSNIPIVPCGLDFKKRTLFIAEKFYPGDDIENDMNSLISYFRRFEGKHKKEIPDFKLN